jgi:hypothetical protein
MFAGATGTAPNHFPGVGVRVPSRREMRRPTRYLLQQFQLYAGDVGRGFASWSAARDGSAEQSFKTGDKLCSAKRSSIPFS